LRLILGNKTQARGGEGGRGETLAGEEIGKNTEKNLDNAASEPATKGTIEIK